MSIAHMLHQLKDHALGMAVMVWFNHNKKTYGQMTQIRIDSQQKQIDIELDLKGEASLMQISIKDYALTTEAGDTFIELGSITTSRAWIDQLLSDYLKPDQKRIKVPGAVKVLL